jgi:AraC-like DNA-binding protein
MDYLEIPPPPELAPWVECVWTLQGSPVGPEPVLPDGRTEIVLHLGDRFQRHGPSVELQPRALFVGPMLRAVTLEPTGRVDVLGIRLRPGAAAPLLGTRLDTLQDSIPSLESVSTPLARIADRLDPQDSVEARIETVFAFLRVVCASAAVPDPRLGLAVEALLATRSVDAAVRAAGWSPRQVQRRFREDVGFGPKSLGRILRLQAAVRSASEARTRGWAGVAADCGYFDQAHFIREFRDVTGRTPAEFFGDEHALSTAFIG